MNEGIVFFPSLITRNKNAFRRSLWGLFHPFTNDSAIPSFAEFANYNYSVIRDDYQIIYNAVTHTYELFNLKDDISEQNDVAIQNMNRAKAMLKQLGDWDVKQVHPVFLEGAVWKARQLKLYDVDYPLTQPEQAN